MAASHRHSRRDGADDAWGDVPLSLSRKDAMAGTMTTEPRNPKAGLGALLTPDNCALILIDHQPFQFAGLRSHDTQTIINNVVGLAKSAKLFGVPTLFTTVLERQGGYHLKPLQDVFPEQKP